MKTLTDRQLQLIAFIRTWQRAHGYAPSIREVAAEFGINVPSAAQHLKALERKGQLRRDVGRQRSLVLTDDDAAPAPLLAVPAIRFVGDIAAGSPISIDEREGEFLELSPHWFGRGEVAALRVRGDSMTGDSINDGDFAIIRLQCEVRANEIAAVRVWASEVASKRLKIVGDQAYLLSSNPEHPPRMLPAHEVEVVGTYAGLMRRSSGTG